jgi:hypothetical protein
VPIDVRVSVLVAASPEDAFEFVSDFERNPEWQTGMRDAQFTSEGPLRAGTTYRQVARFLGRRIEIEFVVTHVDPGREIVTRTLTGPFPITVVRTVVPDGDGARVSAHVTAEPRGAFRLADPILERFLRAAVEREHRRLKDLLDRRYGRGH